MVEREGETVSIFLFHLNFFQLLYTVPYIWYTAKCGRQYEKVEEKKILLDHKYFWIISLTSSITSQALWPPMTSAFISPSFHSCKEFTFWFYFPILRYQPNFVTARIISFWCYCIEKGSLMGDTPELLAFSGMKNNKINNSQKEHTKLCNINT